MTERDLSPDAFLDELLALNLPPAELREAIKQIVAAAIEQATDTRPLSVLNNALTILQNTKPNDRSVMDRGYAVAITDLEKLIAYVSHYIGEPAK